MDGKGEFYVSKTGTNYVGNFSNNQFINGVITYANKDQYSGAVRNGLRDDNQGRYLYNVYSPDNIQVRYVGGWKNDRRHDESGLGNIYYNYSYFDLPEWLDSERSLQKWQFH